MKFSLVLLALAFSVGAFAQESQVCFERVYSKEHLKQNPKQLVKSIRVTLTQEDNLYNSVDVVTVKPIKGAVKFTSGGACQISTGILNCGFDADGGNFLLTDSGKSATMKISSALFLYRLDSQDDTDGRDLVLDAGKVNGIYKLNSVPCK